MSKISLCGIVGQEQFSFRTETFSNRRMGKAVACLFAVDHLEMAPLHEYIRQEESVEGHTRVFHHRIKGFERVQGCAKQGRIFPSPIWKELPSSDENLPETCSICLGYAKKELL